MNRTYKHKTFSVYDTPWLTKQHAKELLALAQLHVEEDDDDSAEAVCNEILEFDPDNFDAWALLGAIYCDKDEHYDALSCLETAEAMKPHDPRVQWNLAACIYNMYGFEGGKGDTIKEHLFKAIRAIPAWADDQFVSDLIIDGHIDEQEIKELTTVKARGLPWLLFAGLLGAGLTHASKTNSSREIRVNNHAN